LPAERARPAAVVGPRERAPLRRLASARAPGCGTASGELSLVMARLPDAVVEGICSHELTRFWELTQEPGERSAAQGHSDWMANSGGTERHRAEFVVTSDPRNGISEFPVIFSAISANFRELTRCVTMRHFRAQVCHP
jgi:hypothetical protein